MRKQSLAASNDNKFLYNGKELQDELGQLDYGARFYDPVIGKWNASDPMAELAADLTPFRYCFNNPVNYTDPYGLYEMDANGNISISNPREIGAFINHLKEGGNEFVERYKNRAVRAKE